MAINPSAPVAPGMVAYVIEAGDTFASLANRLYGDARAADPLAAALGRSASDALNAGDQIVLPERLIGFDALLPALANLLVFGLVGVVAEIPVACFAPGAQLLRDGDPAQVQPGERCTIRYTVFDPVARVHAARIEVASASDPNTPLARIALGAAQYGAGQHELQWDGRGTEADMAGKCINPLHSPYAVRVVLTAGGVDQHAEAQIAVRVKGLKIERAPDVADGRALAPGTDAFYQQRLVDLGFHCGPVDGSPGTKTKRAIKYFQHQHAGLRQTGNLDANTKAYLDESAPAGSGLAHYQFILNYIGYGCGPIDGLSGKKTRRAVGRYRADKGLGAGDALDDATKQALDAEVLAPLERRDVLAGDRGVGDVHENPLPPHGAEKKVFIEGSSALCPGSLPYNRKYREESRTLLRPHFPLRVRPLLETSTGGSAFSADASGPIRINFTLDTTAPPADLGVPNATARAYVQTAVTQDGHEADTGHHAHANRGGVRRDNDPGVFLAGKSLRPYEVTKDGLEHFSRCIEEDGAAKGTAGGYFCPSTIAGDRFSIIATVDDDGFDNAPAPEIKVQTGTLIVWRRYHVAKRWLMGYVPGRPHRTESAAKLGLPQWYDPAFVDFVEPVAPVKQVIAPRNADLEMIDLPLYTALLREANYTPAQLPNAQIQTRYNANILWPLTPTSVYNAANEQRYHDDIDDEITAFEDRFAETLRELSYLEAAPGLVVLVFDENAPVAGNGGIHAIANAQLRTWAWSLLASTATLHLIWDQDTDATAVANGALNGETLAHEFGHALWLHHASTSAGNNPAAANQPEHNPAEYQSCAMSYVTLPKFCGKCVLKLRGFDESTV